MEFIIHGTDKLGNEDSISVTGETLEEIRDKAHAETEKRGWTDCWSEQIN